MSARQVLGRWDSVAISIGVVIGVGIFRVPQVVAGHLSSPDWILTAWLIGGIFSLLGALCYAELASRYPHSGGDYVYLKEAYGPVPAFLFAWSELLITRTGSVAAIALLFGEFSCSLAGLPASLTKPVAIAVVILLTVLNLFGLKQGSRIQNLLTVTKLLALFAVIASGIIFLRPPASDFGPATMTAPDLPLVKALGVALVPIMWTYGGWRDNVFLAGETKEASRSVPFALLTTCFVVTGLYIAVNLLYLWFLPPAAIAASHSAATDVFVQLYGQVGARILDAFIVLYSLGIINALLITGSHLAHAMAEDNPLFAALTKRDEKTHSPRRALIFNGLWACILIVPTSFNDLLFFTGLAVWIFFSMVMIAVLILRRRRRREEAGRVEEEEGGFDCPGYPLVPVVSAVVALYLASSTVLEMPKQSLIGTLIVLGGIPVFYMQTGRRAR